MPQPIFIWFLCPQANLSFFAVSCYIKNFLQQVECRSVEACVTPTWHEKLLLIISGKGWLRQRPNNLPNISWQLSEPLGGDLRHVLYLLVLLFIITIVLPLSLCKCGWCPDTMEIESWDSHCSQEPIKKTTSFMHGKRKYYYPQWRGLLAASAEGRMSSLQCTGDTEGIWNTLPKFLARLCWKSTPDHCTLTRTSLLFPASRLDMLCSVFWVVVSLVDSGARPG